MGARRRTKAVYCNNGTFQSTYPVQGTPPPISGRRLKTSSFNPRAPCGAGRKWGGIPTGITQFQSTHPVGARQQWADICGHPLRISIHLPRVGQDDEQLIRAVRQILFQSTCPVWGRTSKEMGNLGDVVFQSTCPVWGRTMERLTSSDRRIISIHLPRVGQDGHRHSRPHISGISIHLPRVGQDQAAQSRAPVPRHFNPPAPCGAGLHGLLKGLHHRDFNPPAPCGAGPIASS